MLLSLLLVPFLGSLIAAFLPAHARNRASSLASGVALIGLILSIVLYSQIGHGEAIYYKAAWLPQFGLEFSLRMDGLAWMFTLLIQGIGLLVVLYARYYMSSKDPVPRFFSFLLAFMGAMLGVVLSGNLIQLVVFWELTSLTSFLLIGYWHHRIDARRGARMAFTVTAAGGLCMLAGFLLLGHVVGSYDLDVVLASGDIVREHSLYLPILILVAIGALTKSAQFPFHFWLPHAMAAPTPVSSYLHSATMVKAGVFLMMRLWPVLAGTPEWTAIVAGAGLCTLLMASFLAIFQHDLKGLLAYSTISHLGLIMLLLGMGTSTAMVAAIFHTLNHAIFKASLFMAAGIIDHETGTRDMRVLRGLRQALPITATLAIVASASMAGVPLLNGFLSKEMFFAETVVGGSGGWLALAAVAMGIFSVTYSLRFIRVFFGQMPKDLPQHPHEPPRWMRFPVEFLVLLCLIVGILPALSVGPLLDNAVVAALNGPAPYYSLALWHGINLPLIMSFVALLGGIGFYWLLVHYFNLGTRKEVWLLNRLNGARIYDKVMLQVSMAAGWLVKQLGTESLQAQLLIMITLLIVGSLILFQLPLPLLPALEGWGSTEWLFGGMWVVGCACALVAAWRAKYQRLAALILVGGTGIIVSLSFLLLSAPDLALTQLMVETVTVILILLGLRWLPPRITPKELNIKIPRSVWWHRIRDLVVAVGAGLVMAIISYAVLIRQAPQGISDFFLQKSLLEGGGTNVVNVLLVDFRAFDTLGEITVLAIVAFTVYALLRRFRPAPESTALPSQQVNPADPAVYQTPVQQADTGYLKIPAVYLRFLTPFMIMVSFYFFLRGHNLPGGGFVAGLLFAVAFIMQYMIAGTAWVESHFRLQPHKWISWGLVIATLTGIGAWFVGYPFLTSHTAHAYIPLLGEVHFPSAFAFDLGVFAVVVGATMLILVALSHQTVRSHRSPLGKLTNGNATEEKA